MYKRNNLNILIPMAGEGSRFKEAGYSFPKPLIDMGGRTMIEAVVSNIGIDAHYIYMVRKEHYEEFAIQTILDSITPNNTIVLVDKLTEGAACTTLLAKELINNDQELLIANSDQLIKWGMEEFLFMVDYHKHIDAAILTFHSNHPKWSYARTDKEGLVDLVAEKNPISTRATVGIYWWRRGSDYVKYAEQMIAKNIRTNNEFYVCPVFNEAIKDGKKVIPWRVHEMIGLGTPEDLERFMNNELAKIHR